MPSIEGGGVEKNFLLVTNFISKTFNKITVITSNKREARLQLSNKIKIIGPNLNIHSFSSRYPKYFFCLLFLVKILIFSRPSLVFAFQANIYASIISKLFLTDIIIRSNSSSDGWSKNKIKSILYKIFLKIPNDVIVNSYDFKKELDKKFNIKTIVIYNPLNKKEIIKKSKEKLNLKFFQTKKHLKLINIGRLVDQKDQLTILKALKIIKKKTKFQTINSR